MSDQTPDIVTRLRWSLHADADIDRTVGELLADCADAADEIERLRAALVEIRQLHQPTSTDYGTRAFCVLCGAADGSWPCTTKIIVNEAGVS